MSVSCNLSQLTSTPTERSDTLDNGWCAERAGEVFRAVEPALTVDWAATKVAEVVEVKGHFRGRFGFDCSRCAEPAELTIEEAFDHHFVGPGQLDAGEETDGFDADPDISEHDGIRIELDELVIELALLALPTVPLCEEGCKGLCPQCGTNLNRSTCSCAPLADNRSPWSALQDFKIAGSR